MGLLCNKKRKYNRTEKLLFARPSITCLDSSSTDTHSGADRRKGGNP